MRNPRSMAREAGLTRFAWSFGVASIFMLLTGVAAEFRQTLPAGLCAVMALGECFNAVASLWARTADTRRPPSQTTDGALHVICLSLALPLVALLWITQASVRAYFWGYAPAIVMPESSALTRELKHTGWPADELFTVESLRTTDSAIVMRLRTGKTVEFRRGTAPADARRWYWLQPNGTRLFVGWLDRPFQFYARCHSGTCAVRVTKKELASQGHRGEVTTARSMYRTVRTVAWWVNDLPR